MNHNRFVTRQMGEEMVLIPLADNVADMTSVLTLNEVASSILKILKKPATGNAVTKKLLTLYNVEEGVLKKDVSVFLQKAVEKNIVEKID